MFNKFSNTGAHMGLAARKPVFGGLRITQARSLISAFIIHFCYRRNFKFLDSLCSWGERFQPRFFKKPKDRFCHVEAHMKDSIFHMTLKQHWKQAFFIKTLRFAIYTRCCYGHHFILLLDMKTTSGLLMYGFITLPDATSCDKKFYSLF